MTTNKTTKDVENVETSSQVSNSSQTTSAPRHEKTYHNYNNRNYIKRKKFCKLCAKGIEHIDFRDVELLQKYLNYNMKITSRKITSACASHQRRISNAIKRARILALIHCVKD